MTVLFVFAVGFGLAGWPAPAFGQGTVEPDAESEAQAIPPCGIEQAVDVALAGTAAGTVESTPTVTPEAEQPVGESAIWNEAFNLSKSGAASLPFVAVEPDGTLHALWWDTFDGEKVAYCTLEDGWSEPQTVTAILGARTVVNGRTNRTPPNGLRVFASTSGWVHAFWTDDRNNLRYARSRSQSGVFALGPTLAINPLGWDVTLDADDELHLVYIRSDNTIGQPAGVYYRSSPSDGAAWRAPDALEESLYFRALPDSQAFIQVVSDGNGTVVASWDDAELRRSFYAVSDDGGQSFDDPIPVETLDQDFARHTRFIALADSPGTFLRLWEAGDGCSLYQQSADLAPQPVEGEVETPTPAATLLPTEEFGLEAAWSDPIRVLDALGNCLKSATTLALPDGKLLAVLELNSPRPLLATWDGERWSEPVGIQISFVEPELNRPITLGCLKLALTGELLAVVGCDSRGDVWTTTNQLALPELLPALTTAWDAPLIIGVAPGDAGPPRVTIDSQGQVYAMWSQSPASGQVATSLVHVNSDGVNWPGPTTVLKAVEGQAEMPVVAVGPGDLLHAVWSGGYAGQIMYSHAFIRDARVPAGWASPRELPAPQPVGGWPDLVTGPEGVLHAIYTVPLNEDRGVYYTRSDDQGETWADYTRVFDAASAGWAMVRSTRLAVDPAGRLHLLWVRAALPGAGSSLGIYYSRSVDGGQTWSEPLAMGEIESDNPRLVVAGPDEIHVAWTEATSAGLQVWHEWSPDGGETWANALPVPGARQVSAPDFGLVSDGSGTLYLTAIERTRQNAAALLALRWDGVSWVDRESVPLGYDPAGGSAAVPVLLPQGVLGVFYRVRAPQGGGGARYIIGYISRPVPSVQIAPVATFTPAPQANGAPPSDAPAPPAGLPTPDVSNLTPPSVAPNVRNQIIIVVVVIVVVAGFAAIRLGRGRR